jgi:hypothetical protein
MSSLPSSIKNTLASNQPHYYDYAGWRKVGNQYYYSQIFQAYITNISTHLDNLISILCNQYACQQGKIDRSSFWQLHSISQIVTKDLEYIKGIQFQTAPLLYRFLYRTLQVCALVIETYFLGNAFNEKNWTKGILLVCLLLFTLYKTRPEQTDEINQLETKNQQISDFFEHLTSKILDLTVDQLVQAFVDHSYEAMLSNQATVSSDWPFLYVELAFLRKDQEKYKAFFKNLKEKGSPSLYQDFLASFSKQSKLSDTQKKEVFQTIEEPYERYRYNRIPISCFSKHIEELKMHYDNSRSISYERRLAQEESTRLNLPLSSKLFIVNETEATRQQHAKDGPYRRYCNDMNLFLNSINYIDLESFKGKIIPLLEAYKNEESDFLKGLLFAIMVNPEISADKKHELTCSFDQEYFPSPIYNKYKILKTNDTSEENLSLA